MRKHCKIISDPDDLLSEWIPFDLWPKQVDAAELILSKRFLIILKARQVGFTHLVTAYALWLMMFWPITTILLFSLRDIEAVDLLANKLRGMYDHLPDYFKVGKVPVDRAHEWKLPNGSRALAFSTRGGRSYTATLVIFDEADYVGNLRSMLRALKPTIDAGGKIIILSTSNKEEPESAFKKIYRAAADGKNDYTPLFLPWNARPDRDQTWYDAQRRNYIAEDDLDGLHQEYPSTATEALAPAFKDKRLAAEWVEDCYEPMDPLSDAQLADLCPRSGIPTPPAIPGLKVYRLPTKAWTDQKQIRHAESLHLIGADPAEGNPTSDDSSMVVIDGATGEECAALSGKVEMSLFGNYLSQLSAWYNNAPVLVERNNHGHTVLLWLGMNAPSVRRMGGLDGKVGWETTAKTKSLVYDHAADVLRNRQAIIHTVSTVFQLQSIEGSTLRAPSQQKDDMAIAFVLSLEAMLRIGREQQEARYQGETVIAGQKPAAWGRGQRG